MVGESQVLVDTCSDNLDTPILLPCTCVLRGGETSPWHACLLSQRVARAG